MKHKMIWMAALLLGIMVACNDDDDDQNVQAANEVWMSESLFLPQQLVVQAGTTVRWVNTSTVAHTVTSTTGLFDQVLSVNASFSFTFTQPGTYLYYCLVHPGMEGTIIVQ